MRPRGASDERPTLSTAVITQPVGAEAIQQKEQPGSDGHLPFQATNSLVVAVVGEDWNPSLSG